MVDKVKEFVGDWWWSNWDVLISCVFLSSLPMVVFVSPLLEKTAIQHVPPIFGMPIRLTAWGLLVLLFTCLLSWFLRAIKIRKWYRNLIRYNVFYFWIWLLFVCLIALIFSSGLFLSYLIDIFAQGFQEMDTEIFASLPSELKSGEVLAGILISCTGLTGWIVKRWLEHHNQQLIHNSSEEVVQLYDDLLSHCKNVYLLYEKNSTNSFTGIDDNSMVKYASRHVLINYCALQNLIRKKRPKERVREQCIVTIESIRVAMGHGFWFDLRGGFRDETYITMIQN